MLHFFNIVALNNTLNTESSLNVLEMAKSISGIRCNPRKRSGDIEGVVAQMRKDTKVVRDKMILQSTPQKSETNSNS